jgi:pimeloyl-ACP methyl ester carboxylesterase
VRSGTGRPGARAAVVVVALLAALTPLLRSRLRPGEAQGRALGPGEQVVRADDGTPLHVEVDGDPSAPLTVVFVHGFTARLGEFAPQRDALRSRARLVLYDQRGHGRSGWGKGANATFEQLGRDLAAVLDATAPRGPVVLLGHSMGGMTVLSLARQRPALFGSRVAGVFLLATSAGELTTHGLAGAWVRVLTRLHLLGLYLRWLRLVAPVVERSRVRGSAAGRAFTRHYLFGRDDAEPHLVDAVQEMLEETPLTVTTAFYAAFLAHDEHETLSVLRSVPVTVLVGTHDRLTPMRHSERMVELIGNAELVVVPGAGHSVNITRGDVVNGAVLALLDRVQERLGPEARAAS